MSLGTTARHHSAERRALGAGGRAGARQRRCGTRIDKTTREVLFLPLPADFKYRAKPFVDVTMDRFAKALGALLLLVLIKPWGLNLDWQRLSYASLAVTGLWIVVAMRARREYLKAFRHSIETGAMAPASVRLDVADAATIETLVEELSDPDESSRALRHRHARDAQQAQPDHAVAAPPRVAEGAGSRAARAASRRASRLPRDGCRPSSAC